MTKVFSFLWNWAKSLRKENQSMAPLQDVPLVQEDMQAKKAVEAFVEEFKKQEERINIMAQKAHDPTCSDIFTCEKKVCFVWEPDKIVSKKRKRIRKKKHVQVTDEMRQFNKKDL